MESLFRETLAGTFELSAFIEEDVGVLKKANNAIFFPFYDFHFMEKWLSLPEDLIGKTTVF